MESFAPDHYVPVLRWKEAERGALAHLSDLDIGNITPLIEIIPENFTQNNKRLPMEAAIYSIAGQLAQSWGKTQLFIDFMNLPLHLTHRSGQCLSLLSSYSWFMGFSIIPVTGLNRNSSYDLAVRDTAHENGQGVCLRITLDELRSDTLEIFIKNHLSVLGLNQRQIDLMIDCGSVGEFSPTYQDIYELIPDTEKWRNLILAGGAFPKDLVNFKKNEKHSIRRFEWKRWGEQFDTQIEHMHRLLTYSDYTIQHARYITRRPGKMHYSASIRYTTDNNWILMRGEDVFRKGGLGFKQYPDLAIMLCDSPYYCGEQFSDGDRYIKEISLQANETGAATQWLQAGINHHMAFVNHQLSTFGRQLATINENRA